MQHRAILLSTCPLAARPSDTTCSLSLSPEAAQDDVVRADMSEFRQVASDLIKCLLDSVDASHAGHEPPDLSRMDDVVVHADESECPQVASCVSDFPLGAADVSLADREHLVHHGILNGCRQGASGVIEYLLHADGVSHVDRELPVLHTAAAPVTQHHRAESHGGESSLAQACDVDPPADLVLYTWNIEGKHDLLDVSGDLHWGLLRLQEVGDLFEAPGHILIRISAGYRHRDCDTSSSGPILHGIGRLDALPNGADRHAEHGADDCLGLPSPLALDHGILGHYSRRLRISP